MYLKKYRFHARKVEDSEHAIYDVCERVRCSLTESRPPAVRRPAPSQIKMYGFCRLFRAMIPLSIQKSFNIILCPTIQFNSMYLFSTPEVHPSLALVIPVATLRHSWVIATLAFMNAYHQTVEKRVRASSNLKIKQPLTQLLLPFSRRCFQGLQGFYTLLVRWHCVDLIPASTGRDGLGRPSTKHKQL